MPLAERFAFEYRADSPAEGLSEWEYDHVLSGLIPAGFPLHPDPAEVAETRFWTTAEIASAIASSPTLFTPWFLHIWKKLQENKEIAP